jgi:hypothetical protein
MSTQGTTGAPPAPHEGAGAPSSPGGRGRAGLLLGGTGVLALVLVAVLGVSLAGLLSPRTPVDRRPAEPGTGDTDREAALAVAPMLELAPAAASPQSLTSATAGPPIALPAPARDDSGQLATAFPPTPQGALAQLAEIMEVGMAGGDPQTWEAVYGAAAEPGAAPASGTWTGRDLTALRRGAGMATSGPAPEGTTVSWTPTGAMVKGSTAGGDYTVACVLGEFVVSYRGRVVTAGWGNCLPMRRVGDRWLIASGPTAALAPSAWPGSADAVAAGWREITR